jgi:hypothetical protein
MYLGALPSCREAAQGCTTARRRSAREAKHQASVCCACLLSRQRSALPIRQPRRATMCTQRKDRGIQFPRRSCNRVDQRHGIKVGAEGNRKPSAPPPPPFDQRQLTENNMRFAVVVTALAALVAGVSAAPAPLGPPQCTPATCHGDVSGRTASARFMRSLTRRQ